MGWHLVWIETTIPGRVPAFEEVEATVKSEWIDEQRAQGKRKMLDRMLARYQVVLPDAAPAAAGGAVTHASVPSP